MTTADVLWELFLIFALARLAGEVAARLGQPPVVGELVVGVAIGSHALGWAHETEVLQAVAEVGVVFLLFEAGLENRLSDLRRVGGRAVAVAVSGVAVPFVAGFLLLALLRHPAEEALFLGTAMVATSVGVTARVLGDLGILRGRDARVILGAAVVDDVLGLLILAGVAASAAGTLEGGRLALLGAEALFFLVFVATVGTVLMRRHGSLLGRLRLSGGPFAFGVAICLGLSALAARIGLAAIVGAFLAGIVLAETREQFEIEKSIEPVTNFLTPFFFVLTGMAVDPAAVARGGTAALAAGVFLLAVVSKLVPCWLASRSALVGAGMVPRAEVGIIVASIGREAGVVGDGVYAVVVAMSVLTAVVTPPALRALAKRGAGS